MTTVSAPELATVPVPHDGLDVAVILNPYEAGYFERAVEYFKTQDSAASAPHEPSYSDRLAGSGADLFEPESFEQAVQRFISEVEEYAAAVANEEPEAAAARERNFAQAPARPERLAFHRVRRVVGTVALAGAAMIGATVAVTVAQTALQKPPTGLAEASPALRKTPATTEQPTTTLEVLTTTTEAAPTTTSQPEEPFSAEVGQHIGDISIPAICEDTISIYEQSDLDTGFNASEEKWELSPGAPINLLNPDPTPRGDCARVDEYAAGQRAGHNPGYQQRTERHKTSSRGLAAQWQPVAVHERNAVGPRSVYPGQEGNAVIFGHGSTYSAPFADTGALRPGDELTFTRADGREFTYTALGYEVVPAADWQRVYEWSDPNYRATLSIFSCVDGENRPGSATHRLVWRFAMVESQA